MGWAASFFFIACGALRLARFFGTDAQSWLNLQAGYDLESAEEVAKRIKREVKPFQSAA